MFAAFSGSARPLVHLGRLRAQFQHVAEHGDALPVYAQLGPAEHVEGGVHGGWVGVVAVVDQLEHAAGQVDQVALATRLGRLDTRQLGRRGGRIRPNSGDSSQDRQRIRDPMGARQADIEFQMPAQDIGADAAAAGFERAIGKPYVCPGVLAEPNDPREARRIRFVGQVIEERVVPVEHGHTVRAHALEDFRLGRGDFLDRGEISDVRGLDVGDKGHAGMQERGQLANLARMVHAQLEDTVNGVARHARQAERQAPMVVQAAGAGRRRRLRSETTGERFLGAGLAYAAGDADEARAAAFARRGAQGAQRGHGVVDQKDRRGLG